MKPFNLLRCIALIAVLPCLAWGSLEAQPMALPETPPDPLPALLLSTPLNEYGSIDLTELQPGQWQTLTAMHVALLKDEDATTRIDAMRNVIHFVHTYGDQADFGPAVSRLHDIFRYERDEVERIYALTALHAIGHEPTMRHLAQAERWEGSDRVRRHIRAVVNDFYLNRGI